MIDRVNLIPAFRQKAHYSVYSFVAKSHIFFDYAFPYITIGPHINVRIYSVDCSAPFKN